MGKEKKRTFNAVAILFILIAMLGIAVYGPIENGSTYDAGHAKIHPANLTDSMISHFPKDNMSSAIEKSFLNWYYQAHTNQNDSFQSLSYAGKSLHIAFSDFLKHNHNARIQLEQLTQEEKAHFKLVDRNAAMNLFNNIQNGHGNKSFFYEKSNGTTMIASSVSSASLPGSFPKSTGEYVLVTVNYYSISWWYPGPWWAPWEGHWGQLNYGEHNVINLLYVGSDAQYWYNHMYNTIGTIQTLDAVAGFILAGVGAAGTYYNIASLASKVFAEVTIIIAATALSIYAIETYISNQLHTMYDSTYANPQNGNPKLLWEFYDVNFYYPWITVVGTFASSFTWNGYTNSGAVSIVLYIPVTSNNPAFVVVSGALSGESHNFAGRIGWNSWGQYYGWQW